MYAFRLLQKRKLIDLSLNDSIASTASIMGGEGDTSLRTVSGGVLWIAFDGGTLLFVVVRCFHPSATYFLVFGDNHILPLFVSGVPHPCK